MIGNLFYLCPSCLAEDSLYQERDFIVCQICSKKYSFKNNYIAYNNKKFTISQFYDIIRDRLELKNKHSTDIIRTSKRARLRQGNKEIKYHGLGNFLSIIESPVEIDKGDLVFRDEDFIFRGEKKQWIFPKNRISGYTTNSKYFEFKIRGRPFYQIYFENESPLKYEDLFTNWFKIETSGLSIIEHQPRITYHIPKSPSLLLTNKQIENWNFKEKFTINEYLLHVFVGCPIVKILRWYSKLTFKNENLIPQKGPFILLMNHESYLDPIIISTLLRRRIGFFTKSTSFANRLLQPILKAYRSLPNRRYEIDPHVIRQAITLLKKGNCIGIFPEGERTWNGKLLPFKYCSIKLLMSVQIPIVIVTIKGSFNVLPRWTHRISQGKIEIEVLRYFSLIPGKWQVEDLKNELELYFKENLSL
jgi:1-acyl-sn-glycerol-3-phosphate acyltransferase